MSNLSKVKRSIRRVYYKNVPIVTQMKADRLKNRIKPAYDKSVAEGKTEWKKWLIGARKSVRSEIYGSRKKRS